MFVQSLQSARLLLIVLGVDDYKQIRQSSKQQWPCTSPECSVHSRERHEGTETKDSELILAKNGNVADCHAIIIYQVNSH